MGTRSGTPMRTDNDSRLTVAMRWSIVGVAVVVLAGLVTAAWLLLTPPGAPDSPPGTAPTTSAGSQNSPGDGSFPSDAGTSTPPTPQAGPSPGATPVEGSEVLPPTDQNTPRNRLPLLPQPTPLISAPLPDAASASGELVAGFPSAVAAPAPGDDVLDSAITSDGSTMQATLKARTDATAATVSDYFRQMWAGLGLTPTGGGEVAASDPFTTVTLAVAESGTGTIYTVFATLRTE